MASVHYTLVVRICIMVMKLLLLFLFGDERQVNSELQVGEPTCIVGLVVCK